MELPMDLISDNILSILPVKSLLRFKSVSKSWNALIKSPYFIKKHQNMADLNHTLPSSALLIHYLSNKRNKICRLNLTEAGYKPIDLDFPFSDKEFVRVLGISHGLVCLMFQHRADNIIITNPATGEFRKIPPCIKSAWDNSLYCFGFGLIANSYKLIRIDYDSLGIKANLYSMDTNTWRGLHVKVDRPNTCTNPLAWLKKVPVLQNGVFYWDSYYVDGRVFVTSFNVSNGVLEEIPFSPNSYGTSRKLIGLKEEVVMVIGHITSWFNIWVLNEKEKTWTMKNCAEGGVTIKSSPSLYNNRFVTVLGGTKSGELLLSENHSGTTKLFSYNMDSGYADVFPCVISGDKFFLFSESLAAIRTGDNVVEDVSDLPMMKRTMKKIKWFCSFKFFGDYF